jgi:hypothetical protein
MKNPGNRTPTKKHNNALATDPQKKRKLMNCLKNNSNNDLKETY